MHRSPFIRGPLVCLALALILSLLPVSPAAAQERPLFQLLGERSLSIIDSPAAIEGRRISVDANLLAGAPERLALPLEEGEPRVAHRFSVERRGAADLAWRGVLEDGGSVILTLKNGYALGLIETATASYELTTLPDGGQVLVRLDHDQFGSCGNEWESEQPLLAPRFAPPVDEPGLARRVDPADSVDIMVLYTPQAQSGAGGTAAIEATAQAAVDTSNAAFADSDMVVRFNLVHVEQADRNDSNNASADRNWMRDDPTVQALRDVYQADMVGLLVENAGSGLCGIAFLMGNQSAAAFAPNGFQVTRRDCAVGNRTFAHEHGHNMGLQHNPEAGASPSQAYRTYAYGHYVNGNYRTVMAAASSPCSSGCPRVGLFSNPDIVFQGAASGIANQRDNSRTSDISAPFVANWRESLPAAASCPSCVDFATTGTVSYSNQDAGTGPVAVLDGGSTLALGGNRWRRTTQTYTVTADTVIEFEFMSTSEGEIHGIGFDEDDTLTNDTRIFQLFGTQNWTSAFQTDSQYTAGDVGTFVSFQLRVGDFYTGSGMRLVLVNDDDGSVPNNTSFFRNVRIFEDGGGTGGPCSLEDGFEGGAAGWFNSGSSTCSTGSFVLTTPSQQSSGGVITQVGGDHTSGGGNAIFTATNTSAGANDVDGGVCILGSPTWNVTEDSELAVYYFHGQRDQGDDPAGDFFLLEISTDGGASFQPLVSIGDVTTTAAWTEATTTVPAGSAVQLRLQVSDGSGPGDIVEGGIDDLSICPLD